MEPGAIQWVTWPRCVGSRTHLTNGVGRSIGTGVIKGDIGSSLASAGFWADDGTEGC